MQNQNLSRREAIARTGLTVGAALGGASWLAAPAPASPAAPGAEGGFVYCFNTSTILGQKVGLAKEIELTAQAGYQAIELWVRAIEQFVKDGGSLPDANKRLRDLGLTFESAIGFNQWLADDDAKRAQALENIKREMDMIAQLGGKRLAAPPAGATDTPGLDLMKAAERYRALLELGDRMGVVPQLELWGASKNLNRLGPCAFVALESGHPKACVLADVFHLYKGGSDFSGLRLFSSQALQVFHVNDYPSDPPREQINDGFRVFPGDGVAPLTQILRDLRAAGGTKVLSLELFSRKYWEQDPAEVAKTGLAKLKAAVAKAA